MNEGIPPPRLLGGVTKLELDCALRGEAGTADVREAGRGIAEGGEAVRVVGRGSDEGGVIMVGGGWQRGMEEGSVAGEEGPLTFSAEAWPNVKGRITSFLSPSSS